MRIESVQDKEWKYIRYYRNDNPQNFAKGQKVNSDSLKLVYRHYVESSLNGEPAVYEELYNLKDDPDETTNVINDLSNHQILQRMKEAWWKLLNEAAGSDVKSER